MHRMTTSLTKLNSSIDGSVGVGSVSSWYQIHAGAWVWGSQSGQSGQARTCLQLPKLFVQFCVVTGVGRTQLVRLRCAAASRATFGGRMCAPCPHSCLCECAGDFLPLVDNRLRGFRKSENKETIQIRLRFMQRERMRMSSSITMHIRCREKNVPDGFKFGNKIQFELISLLLCSYIGY